MPKFKRICHLGGEHVTWRDDEGQDLRLAQRGDDHYLYDWSGDSPDRTDDGPLRIAKAAPLEVGVQSTRVQVYVEDSDRFAYCFVETRNLPALLAHVPGLTVEFDAEMKPLVRLVLSLSARALAVTP